MMVEHQILLVVVLCAFLPGQFLAIILPSESLSHHLSPSEASTKRDKQPRMHDDMFKAFEANLLRLFGLRQRPKPDGKTFVPQYMRDLYDSHLRKTNPSTPTSGRGYLPANTVRSFYHIDTKLMDCTEENAWTLMFNTSNMMDEEVLTAADLRIYWDPNHNLNYYSTRENNNITKFFIDDTNNSYNYSRAAKNDQTIHKKRNHFSVRVEIHEVISPARWGGSTECITRLIDTKVIHTNSSTSSWIVFDVHPAVLKWKRTPHLNHGLHIRLLAATRKPVSVQPHRHIRLKRAVNMEHDEWHNSRPLLVTYTDDGKGAPIKRSRRSARHRRERGKKKGRRSRKPPRRRKASTECRRHPMYVSFSEVGWTEWIVAPVGYQAFYCEGKCPFPISDYLNSTNHAIVQTLVNSVMPNKIPQVCCVPTELSSISMLYLDEQEKVVLKNYQGMVVKACGCR